MFSPTVCEESFRPRGRRTHVANMRFGGIPATQFIQDAEAKAAMAAAEVASSVFKDGLAFAGFATGSSDSVASGASPEIIDGFAIHVLPVDA
jgi:hypothetical protein